MRDEEYLFHSEVREKKVTGYSARKARTHCGKSGRVKFPSDYLTKKELKNMSGECKSYRLNEPMRWAGFKAMPDDLKVAYILAIREKYNAPDNYIYRMLGTSDRTFKAETDRLGLSIGKTRSGRMHWNKDGFLAWAYGIPMAAKQGEDVIEPAETVEEDIVVEDDLPWNAPEEEEEAPASEPVTLTSLLAVPESGSMTFTGDATQIMNTLVNLFGGANIKINVHWDVMEA